MDDSQFREPTNFSSECRTIKLDGIFVTISCTMLFTSFCSIAVSCGLVALVSRATLLHANVRFLLMQSVLGALVTSISILINAGYNFAIYFWGFRMTHMTRLSCWLMLSPFVIFSPTFNTFLVSIGWERFYATLRRNQTDLDKPSKGVKIFSAYIYACSVVLMIYQPFSSLLQSDFSSGRQALTPMVVNEYFMDLFCYCDYIFIFKIGVYGPIIYFFICNLSSILVYWFVYKTNLARHESFGINQAKYSLQERFQTANNMKATKMLFPLVISQSVCGAFIGIGYALLVREFDKNSAQQHEPATWCINLVSTLHIIHGLDISIMPFIWLKCDENFMIMVFKRFPLLRKVPGLNARSTTRVHSLKVSIMPPPVVKMNRKSPNGVLQHTYDQNRNNPAANYTCPTSQVYNKESPSRTSEQLVDYRIDPENAEEIVLKIWSTRKPDSCL